MGKIRVRVRVMGKIRVRLKGTAMGTIRVRVKGTGESKSTGPGFDFRARQRT
jgi:hypothetical protein